MEPLTLLTVLASMNFFVLVLIILFLLRLYLLRDKDVGMIIRRLESIDQRLTTMMIKFSCGPPKSGEITNLKPDTLPPVPNDDPLGIAQETAKM